VTRTFTTADSSAFHAPLSPTKVMVSTPFGGQAV
jgi:hypothetical protein